MSEGVAEAEQVQSLASPTEHDESGFFLNPKAVADSQFKEGEPKPAEVVKPRKPEAKGVAPPEPTHIPESLFELAESLGVSREDAKAFGSADALSRTLSILRRQAQAESARQQQSPQTQQQPKEDEPFNPDKFASDEWLPELKEMAAVVARLEKQNRDLANQVRQLSGIEGHRQNEQGKAMFHGAVKDLGLESVLKNPAQEQSLLARANGLAEMYRQIGEKVPPPKELIGQAAQLLKLNPQPRQPQQPAARPRHTNGVGAPTHRRFEMERPNRLAQTLADHGVDPGPERQETDYSFFLGQ